MRAFQAPIVTVLVWSVTAWRLFGLFDFFGVSMHLVKAYHWNACQCVPLWNEFWLWIYDQLQKKFQQVNSHANSFNQNTPPSPPPHKPVEHRFIDIFVLKMKGIKFSKVKLLPGRTTLNSISASGTASLESFRSAKKLTTFTTPTTY